MITRVWHGKTKKEVSDKYRKYIVETGIKDYLNSKDILNVQLWQQDENDITHFYTVTNWKDLEAIKKFSGDNYENAKYYPEDKNYLLELEKKVNHFNASSYSNVQLSIYIRQIQELYNGDNWMDENFSKKLNNLKSEIAFKQPYPGKHSVAEVLWHCIYWRKVLIKRMEGDREFGRITEEEQNFLSLELLKKKGWKKLLAEFADIHKSLINFLKVKNDNFLEEEYQSGYTNKYVIEGIISHDYYHLGQIGYIISLLTSF